MLNDSPKIARNMRKHARIQQSIPIKICLAEGSGSVPRNEQYEAIAENISEQGLGIDFSTSNTKFVKSLVERKFDLTVSLRMVSKNLFLTIPSKIVWIRSAGDLIDHRLKVGVEFNYNSQKIAGDLKEFIGNRQLENGKSILTYTLLIDGEDVDTKQYEYFPYADQSIIDYKATYKVIYQLKKGAQSEGFEKYIYARYCVGVDDTNLRAISAAYEAHKKFKKFPLSVRRKILGDIHDLLVTNRDEIIKLLVVEGHSRKLAEWEFLGMERAYASSTLDFYANEIHKEVRDGDDLIFLVRKSDGVVCVSPPKNASCSNSLLAAFALLVGNTIVIKPPLKCPVSTVFLWKNIINRALELNGAPRGCVNIVLGNSKKITDEWLKSPQVADILYFGDSETGLEIGRQAYLCNKKAILELSGNDQLFVWKDADISKAVDSFIDGFLGSTQICMVPKNAFIHSDIYEEFVAMLKTEVERLIVGLPSSPDTYLTPVIKTSDFYNALYDALAVGGRVICGGNRINYWGELDSNGAYIQPTLIEIDQISAKHAKVVREENFFPLLPLIKITGASDQEIYQAMVNFSNDNNYGLRTSVWVASPIYINRFISDLDNSGLLKINSRHVGFASHISTHGGTKNSGGPYGEMNHLWQKTSHIQGIVIKNPPELKLK